MTEAEAIYETYHSPHDLRSTAAVIHAEVLRLRSLRRHAPDEFEGALGHAELAAQMLERVADELAYGGGHE